MLNNNTTNPLAEQKNTDVSEAQIAVHWPEEAYCPPTSEFVAQAYLTDTSIFERCAEANFPERFKEYAALLDWYEPWNEILDTSHPPFWCMADIGWITGHSYIVYGPLALGASSVIYAGVPTHPDAGRPWRIAEELDVDIFHTSPTAIRALRRAGPEEPAKYDFDFKHMTTVGEPIEPEVWRWYHAVVGKGEAVIVDTWWQTETGGFLCSTVPGVHNMKPGSAGPALPGIYPTIYDDEGVEIPAGANIAGNLCVRTRACLRQSLTIRNRAMSPRSPIQRLSNAFAMP
jgi:acyl-coenzyme A synthetase/AMP-(fatty) acid ligase